VAALIAAQKEQHRIPSAVACRALGVSRSWFYKHEAGELPPRAARRAVLAAEVCRLFAARRGTDGSPRITADGTEIPTGQGKLYLASVLDMGSRRVLGFALGEHHDAGEGAASSSARAA
jgi:transposase InsO family protein